MVHGTELPVIEYRGQRVVTLAMVDKVHQRVEGTARRSFNANRERFVEGEDYFEVTADEIRSQSMTEVFAARTPKGILLTESGYLMAVKSLHDDLAWAVQRDLVKAYFRVRAAEPAPAPGSGHMPPELPRTPEVVYRGGK